MAGPVLAGRSDWRELSVGHFHLYSTVSDSKTRDFAVRLQGFEQTAVAVLNSNSKLPDVPMLIYLMGDRDYKRYLAPRPGTQGFFDQLPFGNLIVVDTDAPFDFVATSILHEYTHFIQRNTSTMIFPPWYVEGYAELLSSASLETDRLVLGKPPSGLRIDMSRWIPVERVLAVKHSDPEYQTERLAPEFYGESWALVHLLLFDDKALLGPTGRYLHAMDEGYPEAESFAASFPFDKSALDKELRKLIENRVIHLKTIIFPNGVSVDTATISRLTEPQADEQFARLVFLLGKPKDLVLPLASAALKENPANPTMRALNARIAARYGMSTDIADLAESVAAGGDFDAQLRIDLASVLLAHEPTETAIRQAFAILDPIVRDAGPPIEAVELWAYAAERTGVEPSRVLSILQLASYRVPHNTSVLGFMASAYEAMGDKPKARDCYNQIILVSTNPAERLWAQRQADSQRLQDRR